MSTIPETIYLLEQYNKWRRGDDTITMPEPFELGVAIGDAVRILREHATLTAEFEKVTLLAAQRSDRNVELRFRMDAYEHKAEGYLERAQKAEAQLHALTLICGTSDANKFQSWVDREREKVRVLREALENLRDEQNGAPLCTREIQWKEAMDKADAALAETKESSK